MERLLIVGARGHARAVLDVIRARPCYDVVGLIDSYQAAGTACLGLWILGGEEHIPAVCDEHRIDRVFVAIGDNFQRSAMVERIGSRVPGLRLANCVHPSAVVGADVRIGDGTVVMPGAIVVSGSVVGEGCILNTACSLDHDGVMEAWSSLGPGVVAGGSVHLGSRTSVGLGARIINGITIGADSVIGAGSLVLDNLPARVVAHGSPCRPVRERAPDEQYL